MLEFIIYVGRVGLAERFAKSKGFDRARDEQLFIRIEFGREDSLPIFPSCDNLDRLVARQTLERHDNVVGSYRFVGQRSCRPRNISKSAGRGRRFQKLPS